MTVLEHTIAILSVASIAISEEFVAGQLIASGLEPSDIINKDMEDGVKEALYELLPIVLLSPTRITEGGYSISYDKNSLMAYYKLLAKQLGKPDLLDQGQPKIEDITDAW